MSATFFDPTDSIPVTSIPMLIFGPPGSWKTTLAQTARKPLTLDFDKGIHRVMNRGPAKRFDVWQDMVDDGGPNGQFKDRDGKPIDYETLVVDTGGRALDTLVPAIIKESAKNSMGGGLSIQGWGVLGNRFTSWLKMVQSWGKQVVMICHQEEAKNAQGDPYFLPDLPGKMAYKEIHKAFDLIGRIGFDGNRRFIDFNPSDHSVAKNAAGWPRMELPDLLQNKTFLADLIDDAKKKIGALSEKSAEVAKAVEEWHQVLNPETVGLDQLNGDITERFKAIGKDDPIRPQVWELIMSFADENGVEFDKKAKKFVEKAGAA